MKYSILLIITLLLSGCGKNINNDGDNQVDMDSVKTLVTSALENRSSANKSLGNLFDSLPVNQSYTSITIDTLKTDKNIYYYILMENPNPAYNRLGIYDSTLSPLLLDKSLNGNIYSEKIKIGGKEFIKVDEAYHAKDTLVLNRISLYSPDPSGFSLVFRTHTKFAKPGTEFYQEIVELSDSLIRTKINSSRRSYINNSDDIFYFTQAENKYSSSQNLFDEFITQEIEDYNYTPSKKQLTRQR